MNVAVCFRLSRREENVSFLRKENSPLTIVETLQICSDESRYDEINWLLNRTTRRSTNCDNIQNTFNAKLY